MRFRNSNRRAPAAIESLQELVGWPPASKSMPYVLLFALNAERMAGHTDSSLQWLRQVSDAKIRNSAPNISWLEAVTSPSTFSCQVRSHQFLGFPYWSANHCFRNSTSLAVILASAT